MPKGTFSSLTCGIQLCPKIKVFLLQLAAKNDEGLSKWSDIVHYKTLPARPEPPGKPQIKGKIHAHVFKITWGKYVIICYKKVFLILI